MGYDSPATTPIQRLAAQLDREARSTRAAATPGGTQSFQSVRKLTEQIEALTNLVLRLPQVVSQQDVNEGFGLDDGADDTWITVASTTIATPAEQTRVVVQASAQGAVLDLTSGATPTVECAVSINGVMSAAIPATQNVGSGYINHVAVVSSTLEISPVGASLTVLFLIRSSDVSQFPERPSNVANLSVYAGYSVV